MDSKDFGHPMQDEATLPRTFIRWADSFRARGLEDLVLILSDLLPAWGFIGGQILWMLAPFVGEAAITPIARALESPEALEELHRYLLEDRIEGD